MKVSIIIPIYNAEKFISKAIKCVLNQTYKNFELILINDGSTDKSGYICDQFALTEKKIKVIHQNNRGVSAARNNGIMHASGEWVCFLDSDDEVSPKWLQSYIDEITDSVDIIFQGAKIIGPHNHSYFNLTNHTYNKDNFSDFINLWHNKEGHIGSAWSKIFRASIIYKYNIKYNETIHNYEDWIFLTQVLTYSRNIKTISASHYIYNNINSNLTSQKVKWNAEQRIAILNARYDAAFMIKAIDEKCFHIYISNITPLLIQTISQIYKEKYPKNKRNKLLHTWKNFPTNSSKLSFAPKTILFIFNKVPIFSDLLFKLIF